MKSLLDIQQDIRNLENNVKDILKSIKNINSDMEELRNINSDENINYRMIEALSKHIKFGKHPLDKVDDNRVCQIYIEMLLNIIRVDLGSEETINRLVFIQWIQTQSSMDWPLQELFRDCYKINMDSYCEFADLIPTKLRENFIVDALLVANIDGSANQQVLEYIAGICGVLGIEKERLKILSLIAQTVLCQNLGKMKKKEMDEIQKCAKNYRYYISADILEKGILNLREIVVQLGDTDVRDFKWKVKQMVKVDNGDVIASYQKPAKTRGYSFSTNYITEEIKTPSSGTIFQFRDNCINYGVIAHDTDNKDSIKAWVKTRGR